MTKTRIAVPVLGGLLLVGGFAIAQPKRNINPGRHPNLAAAQTAARNAFNDITKAQEANEWDLQGHAKKAKELLEQVNNELKLAAEASNERKK